MRFQKPRNLIAQTVFLIFEDDKDENTFHILEKVWSYPLTFWLASGESLILTSDLLIGSCGESLILTSGLLIGMWRKFWS